MDEQTLNKLAELVALLSGRRRMPPWQEATYFLPPAIYSRSFSPGTNVQLAPGNGNRVVLILSSQGAVWLTPGPPTIATTGLFIPGSGNALILTEAQHGNLVQLPWYINALGSGLSGNASAIDVSLREWPAG